MKEDISALMDGELSEDDAGRVFDRLKTDPTTRKNWAAYHLIGDVLRQPEHIHSDLSARVRDRLQDEPYLFVPRRREAKQRMRTIALSAAASLSAIGVVVGMSLQISPEVAPQLAMKTPLARPADAQLQPKSGDYLMAHQEFSPSPDINGGTYYIRTVSYGPPQTSNNISPASKSK
jgi:sigma-E factor negative regulatory protein RseA